jgi:hypothetical protein
MLNALGVKPSEVMMKHLSRPAEKVGTGADAAFRAELLATFASDIDRLETLTGSDLSAWRV